MNTKVATGFIEAFRGSAVVLNDVVVIFMGMFLSRGSSIVTRQRDRINRKDAIVLFFGAAVHLRTLHGKLLYTRTSPMPNKNVPPLSRREFAAAGLTAFGMLGSGCGSHPTSAPPSVTSTGRLEFTRMCVH